MAALPVHAIEQLQRLAHADLGDHRGLAVIAITGGNLGPDLAAAPSALAAGTLVVGEVEGRARVPELEARNRGACAVLLAPGLELLGGLQHRVVNAPVVIGAGATVRVPVSCLERGRWHSADKNWGFSSKGRSVPPKLRHGLYRRSTESLGMGRDRRGDQAEVWREVEREARRRRVSSRTDALADVLDARERERGPAGPWPTLPTQVGFFAAAGGSPSLEIFSTHTSFATQGCASLEALADSQDEQRKAPDESSPLAAAPSLLTSLCAAQWSEHTGVGEGTEYRATLGPIEAVALILDQTLVYLSAIADSRPGAR